MKWFCTSLLIATLSFGQEEGLPVLQSRSNGSNLVTVQELRHVVPKAAQAEFAKWKTADSKGRMDQAIDHLYRAVAIDPEFVAARNNLAVRLMETDPKRAIAEFEEAIKIDPHQPNLWGNLAVGYAMQDQFAEAERTARVAARLDRTSLRPQIVLGVALVEQHKYTPEALECLERARKEYPVASLYAASIFKSYGEFEKAKSAVYVYLATGQQLYRDEAVQLLDRLPAVATTGDKDR
jgi:tetratricopeptide (TPR) repeat protein